MSSFNQRVVIIGGTGHIGSYLVPRLVTAGYDVVCITRGARQPYSPDGAWKWVQTVVLDREVQEEAGVFGKKIRELKPDIVLDMICFTPQSAQLLVEALKGQVGHFVHTGTIWVHGHKMTAPTGEDAPRIPFCSYGKQKAAIEAYLLKEARVHGFPATILHPGHIVGRGWVPLNPAGNFNPAVFHTLARGEKLALPNLGMETVHHVHADDVAQAFMLALANRSVALGESFHVVSPAALTLRGYAEAAAAWFGQEANLVFLPWKEWRAAVSEEDANATWDHIAHSPCCSIEKARRLLGYHPRYTSLQAVQEAVESLNINP